MSDQPPSLEPSLELIMRKLDQVIQDNGIFRDDMRVQTAIIMRIDTTMGTILAEPQTTDFDEELGKLISELAARPIEIDSRRVRWCLDHGIPPFANVADGEYEAWQLVTDKELEGG